MAEMEAFRHGKAVQGSVGAAGVDRDVFGPVGVFGGFDGFYAYHRVLGQCFHDRRRDCLVRVDEDL